MTEVLTQSAVHAFGMSTSERVTRRRSAQSAPEGAEERPAKRARTGESTSTVPTKQAAVKKSSGTNKKAKTTYEEEDDGFKFSRAKAKKPGAAAASKAEPSKPAPASAPVVMAEPAEPAEKPSRSTSTRRKRSLPEEQPAVPSAEQPEPRTRRSNRLSGGLPEPPPPKPKTKAAVASKSKAKPPAKEAVKVKDASKDVEKKAAKDAEKAAPQDALQEVAAEVLPQAKTPRVAELRAEEAPEEVKGPTKIALPFADTPVIQRNKEMRKNSAQGHRRSSAGMRGRRASSLMDAGLSNALPHSEVETSDFYKHINQDLLETRRMKQLLVWCGTRALPEKSSDAAIMAARVIQDELLKDFSNKSEMSDWFNREDIAPASLIKKPNPRNVQNAAKLQELELEVKRLQEEKASWDSMLSGLSSTVAKETVADEALTDTTSPINASLLDPQDAALLESLTSQDDIISSTLARFQRSTQGLEMHIDNLAEGVHKLEKMKEAVDELADRVQSQAAEALERRDQAALERTGVGKVGVGDLLRSLARS